MMCPLITPPELLALRLFLLAAAAVTAGHKNGPGLVTVVVSEGSDGVLPCSLSTNQSLEQQLFSWRKGGQKEVFMYDAGDHDNKGRSGQNEQFRGRVSHFPGQLRLGNASIIIRNTKVDDSGNYTCEIRFPHQGYRKQDSFNIKLVVGATPKPFVGILKITEDGALLKCEVPGASPKPKVEWQDSDGNILHAEEPQVSYRGDRYYITLLTTVTRTNTNLFHCVATQEETHLKTEDEIHIPDKLFEPSHGDGVLAGLYFSGFLTAALPLALCWFILYILYKRKLVQKASERNQRDNCWRCNCKRGDTEEIEDQLILDVT